MSSETILVTGGSRGIGRGIVRALDRGGARVAFTYVTDCRAAEDLAAALEGRARPYQLDLADLDGPHRLAELVEKECGAIKGLVNNAGSMAQGLLAMTSDAEWHRVIEINLGGVFRCCRAVLPLMMHRKSGSIVNIASLGAIHGVRGQSTYAASKAGVVGLTRSLAREVGRRNVRVNAVAPGFVATEMTADLPGAQVEAMRAAECLPGGVDIVSVAETVRFLLSDAASAITGQCLIVDAGASA